MSGGRQKAKRTKVVWKASLNIHKYQQNILKVWDLLNNSENSQHDMLFWLAKRVQIFRLLSFYCIEEHLFSYKLYYTFLGNLPHIVFSSKINIQNFLFLLFMQGKEERNIKLISDFIRVNNTISMSYCNANIFLDTISYDRSNLLGCF